MVFVNIYASSIGAPKFRKQILADPKEEIASNTVTIGTSIPHFQQWIDHLDRKSVKKY